MTASASNKKNILVTGANGQLGQELRALSVRYPQHTFFFAGKEELSVTDAASIDKHFAELSFTHCINCAANIVVDKAEMEKDSTFAINCLGAANLAAACKKYGAQLIHISTDYVFDGESSVPYKETDQTHPLNFYGISKLQGEQEAMKNDASSVIIRTSWVYGIYGKNFLKTMLRLMSEKESISVVNDQFGSPTYATDLAEAILTIIFSDKKPVPGIYHFSNTGMISWYDFAVEIKKMSNSKCDVNPIDMATYATTAKRPKYSVMDTTKIQQTFGITIPKWKESLEKCFRLIETTNK